MGSHFCRPPFPLQAWADGSISVWDNFADLTNKPPQAYYRLSYP
jgi:hypothetical protein